MTYILITQNNITRIDAAMWERVKHCFVYWLGQSDIVSQDVHIVNIKLGEINKIERGDK